MAKFDVVIIGSGPNGLSAAITLAKAGLSVQVIEASQSVGGGMRTAELTLPGFQHDVCSAVHPMGVLSPFFLKHDLQKYGLEWVYPTLSVAHPLDKEPAVLLKKSIAETANGLGSDAEIYQNTVSHLVENQKELFEDILKPLGLPKNPVLLSKFGLKGMQSAEGFVKNNFKNHPTKALFAGCAAHSILPFDKSFTAAVGLMFLVAGHATNWPVAKGGSQKIADAMAAMLLDLGGEIVLNTKIENYEKLPDAKAYIFDTNPHQMIKICKNQLSDSYKSRVQKFNYGPGVFKIDFALNAPIPWRDANCLQASTVHIGGLFEEIAASEKEIWNGKHSEKPYVLLAQQSQFDNSRSPEGKHTGWAYCHVPNGSEKDMTAIIENQIERFAPGFKDTILAKNTMNTQRFESYNPNYVGGAISGGASDIMQLFSRPVFRLDPYSTPNPKIFIGSASSPPGGGVHGMCGYYAALSVLKKISG